MRQSKPSRMRQSKLSRMRQSKLSRMRQSKLSRMRQSKQRNQIKLTPEHKVGKYLLIYFLCAEDHMDKMLMHCL